MKKKVALYSAGIGTAVTGLLVGASVHAQSIDQAEVDAVKASSTAAIKAVRVMSTDMFYANWLYIVLGILAVGVVIWGTFLIINRITHRGGKK